MRRPAFARRSAVVVAVVVSLAGGAGLTACGDDGDDGDDAGDQVVLSAAGERGKEVARAQGCISCHSVDGSSMAGPTWKDLAGSQRTLSDGETVTADDEYLAKAILASRAEVVEGYANIMPVYEGEIDDAELADLIAYLRDLSSKTATGPEQGTTTD